MTKTFLLLLYLAWVHWTRAGDIVVTYDFSVGTIGRTHYNRIEATRSLWDYLVFDNGLAAPSDKLQIIIKPDHLTGALAQTETSGFYQFNSRGKLVLDGNYPVTIRLNMDAGLSAWPDVYLEAIVAHEIGHALGFDSAVWWYNGYVTGSWGNFSTEYGPTAIQVIDGHFSEFPDFNSLMTPGIAYPGTDTKFTAATLTVVEDNGWTVRQGFAGGKISDLLPPGMTYVDEEDFVEPVGEED